MQQPPPTAAAATAKPRPAPHCQCYADAAAGTACALPPQPGSVFCALHAGGRCAPPLLSGSEQPFDTAVFDAPRVRSTHNCYAYAVLGQPDPSQLAACTDAQCSTVRFHQPGEASGQRGRMNARELRTCPVVSTLMRSDTPAITPTTFAARCPAGSRKVALVVDPGRDYHFYAQMRDGWWAHKPGSNRVQRLDGALQPIYNPQLAVNDYRANGDDLNYEDFCGFFCVPATQGAVQLRQGTPAAQAGGRGGAGTRRPRRRRHGGGRGAGVWQL